MTPHNCPVCLSGAAMEDDRFSNPSCPRFRVACTSNVCRFKGPWGSSAEMADGLWNRLQGRDRPRLYSETLNDVVDLLRDREAQGMQRYGCTVDRIDQTEGFWIRNALEEALDLAMYLARRLRDIEHRHEKQH